MICLRAFASLLPFIAANSTYAVYYRQRIYHAGVTPAMPYAKTHFAIRRCLRLYGVCRLSQCRRYAVIHMLRRHHATAMLLMLDAFTLSARYERRFRRR